LRLDAFEGVDVGEILFATRRAFVRYERVTTDNSNGSPFQIERRSVGDGFVERDAIRSVQDVDAQRRHAELQNPVVRREVSFAYLERFERGPEDGERLIDALRVATVRANEHVEVLGCPRVSVKSDGVPAEDDELGPRVGEGDEEVAKVLREVHRYAGQGTNFQGIWLRV
jgi:hypothetical protein